LLPSLALCYVWKTFSTSFFLNLAEFLIGLLTKDKSDRQADLGKEIHALSCASKPVSSWTTQQVIQECREACGGHGMEI
jgi:acyl-CoA oxidase